MRAYLRHYSDEVDDDEERVLFDFLYNEDKKREAFTRKIFGSYKEFEKELQKVFRDRDEKLYA
ncbi:hypothetical protein VTG60DRAFT_2549 [Thermothelomyces hinnuleus]